MVWMENAPIGVLQSVRMDYLQGVPLYEDKPEHGLVLKLIMLLPAVLAAAGIYHWFTGDALGGIALLVPALIVGLVFWLVFPRAYRVYEDHLCIVLGGPFLVRIGFHNVKTIRVASGSSLSVNFCTRITRTCVEIVKKKGLSIMITPTIPDSFVEEANRALGQWAKTGARRAQ